MKRTHHVLSTLVLFTLAVATAFAQGPNNSGTYYQNADGKKGAALKTALCGIIYSHTELSYNALWTAYYTTDKRADGKVWDMYSNITNYTLGDDQDKGNHSAEGDCYNREHSFPKNWFGGSVSPMYTDLFHLYPTDAFVNGMRSNYPFGETNGESDMSANGFSKLGSCTYPGYTGTVFEPNNEYKGDFARTYFYMVTCYENQIENWTVGQQHTLDGNKYPGLQAWQLGMLMKWAQNDPVSEKEINRNNAVKQIQGNRNPFIDYPGLERFVWGDLKDVAFSYDNYSTTGEGGGGDTPDPDPIDPSTTITVDQALTVINGLVAGASTEVDYTVKGYVVSTPQYNSQNKNLTFVVADSKTATVGLTVFRANKFNDADIESATLVKQGDEVVLKGKLQNYVNNDKATPEIMYPVILTINDETEVVADDIEQITVAKALEIAGALDNKASTTKEYRVHGFITDDPKIDKRQDETFYGNANFHMADTQDGEQVLYGYHVFGVNREKMDRVDYIKKGDELIVQGVLKKWNDDLEIEGFIYSLNGSQPEPDPTAVTLTVMRPSTTVVMYNLAGQQVTKNYKGLVIVNGRRFVNK